MTETLQRSIPGKRAGLISLFMVLLAIACAQANQTAIPTIVNFDSPPTPQPAAAQINKPILIGSEYIVIQNPRRVSVLAKALAPLGLTAAKPLPDNFSWGEMQSSPEAAIDFSLLDNFVQQFQQAGVSELVLALKSNNSWASNSFQGEGFFPLTGGVKEQYLEAYSQWVGSVVERYDADGLEDMPGLLHPIRLYEIGVEFSSFEPEPVEEYLKLLERAYTAAHQAYENVLVAHAAFLTAPALSRMVPPEELESRFASMADRTHSLEDFRRILDRPALFDVINFHAVGNEEIEATMAWLRFEMEQRGYDKPVILSDTITTPFIAWGPATACDQPTTRMGIIIPPATEEDRCRLADYFSALLGKDEPTLRWTQGFSAMDLVKKVIIAAEQDILLINTAYTEDLLLLTLPLARAGAGTAAWAGLLNLQPREYRAGYYALQQTIDHLGRYESIMRLLFDDPGIRVYQITSDGQEFWVAWYEPDTLLLPGDAFPQTTVEIQVGSENLIVERLITEFGETTPDQFRMETEGGTARLVLTPLPVFLFAGN